MEDNSSSDDEVRDSSFSMKMGGKKLKLNDGSSHDSLKDIDFLAASSSKDENVDSGVSADKSESTSSDDKIAESSEGPSNEVVAIAPSGSNIQAILLNFTRTRRGRIYRKRKTSETDTNSNASSRDSDDLSADETPQSEQNDNSNSDAESDAIHSFSDLGSTESDATNSGSNSSVSNSNESYESDDMMRMQSGDNDSDGDVPRNRRPEGEEEDSEENKERPPPVLLKQRPKHNYDIVREIMNREMGLTFPNGKTIKDDVMFERRFYGSLHAVYRMKKLHNLNKHRGCVNSINFHPEGHLLVSGSDDTNIVIWDWAKNSAIQTVKTGHKSNVFQSKFLYLNAQSQLNIVTCARDGQVRLVQVPSSGGVSSRRRLCTHARAAHKLHVCGAEPHLVLSAGEDGLVMQCDVRDDHASRLFQVKDRNTMVPLYSVHGHPLDPKELVVAGRDKYIRVYDRRKSPRPLALYCPTFFLDSTKFEPGMQKQVKFTMSHLTCAVYNHDGTEILGSYNDEDIYLFDTKANAKDPLQPKPDEGEVGDIDKIGYTYRYSGHRNSATFKGVAFFGPNSEYVVSGSDCSNIYMWHKKSESIVQWMQGDVSGVVNCVEAHPRYPVLATSGLDRDVKIWIPKASDDPTFDGLNKVVRANSKARTRSPLFNDFLPTLYSAWASRNGEARANLYANGDPAYGANIEFDGNVCTTF